MKYSLATHILAITLPSALASQVGISDFTVGGEGSYLDSISIDLDKDFVTTEGDATGSYVHNIDLCETGKVTISINQVSDKVARFKRICNIFRQAVKSGLEVDGMTMTLTDLSSNVIATMKDCLFAKIPTQEFASAAGTQTWIANCGQISFN